MGQSDAELDDRWRKQLKNQVLGLRLADKDADEIAPTLEKRYKNQLKRVEAVQQPGCVPDLREFSH